MTKSQTLRTIILKTLFFFICICIGFSAFTKCDAQNIIGKWKGVSVKNYYSTDYAKKVGKSMEEKFSKDIGSSEINYIADHTFIMSFSELNSSDVTTMKGTWNVMGDQLKLTLEPKYNPQKITTTATFSINGNTMITTAIISPPSRIIKTESTGIRL